MSAAVRTIQMRGDMAAGALRGRAQEALDAWTREWATGDASATQPVRTVRLATLVGRISEHGSDGWDVVRSQAGCIWFRNSVAERLRFGEAVVGSSLLSSSGYADDWIGGIAERAWQARNRAVAAALLGAEVAEEPGAPLSEAVFAFGSGAVLLSCEELGLYAIADEGVWQSIGSSDSAPQQVNDPVTSLDQAMRHATVRVEVVLGSVEIDLPKLLDLRRGDILRLPRRLDEGISVLCEGQPFASALLGEAQGRKGVQVLPPIREEKVHDDDRH